MRPLMLLGWLSLLGCSPAPESVCLGGDTRACDCGGLSTGTRLCTDGSFGACMCAGTDGGVMSPDGGAVEGSDAGSSLDAPTLDAPMRPTPMGTRASTFGYDSSDATAAFRAAIESDDPSIIIDGDLGTTWYVDPSRFTGLENKTIFIEEGVTIQARPGRYDDPSAMIFRCTRCRNVQIYGYGAIVRGLRDEEFNAEDMSGEWRHSFALYEVENFLIEGLTIQNSGGDAIYITGAVGTPSRDIAIVNVSVDGARRQGISVISVDGLRIRGFRCQDVRGRYPMAGIDFEPNERDQVLTDIELDDVRLERNGRTGVFFALSQMDASSTPVEISIRNLYLRDNWIEEAQYVANRSRSEIIFGTAPPGTVRFENVYVDGSQQGFIYDRSDATSLSIEFTNVVARGMNTLATSWSPIGLEVRDYSVDPLPMGNMSFTNVHISTAKSTILTVRGSNTSTNVLRNMIGEIRYVGDYDPITSLVSMDGEESYTLTFAAEAELPSRMSILGW